MPTPWERMSQANIGRYQIVAELGKGAMGVVYKALDPNIGRTVALKTVRLDAAGAEAGELSKRFRNEARAAGVLSHPNIVTIYDAGDQDGVLYIAMEFIEGTTLQALLAHERVQPVERVVEIGRQVCMGLEYAHSKGVVHRDVKPANIMIAPDGTVKIMDFGIAKAGATLTHTGQVLGTPSYMSPEQVRGRTLDGRSDLFSMGVILYEMLTGERPFAGESVTTIVYKIVNENPIPPRELDVTIHPGISAMVLRALSKLPEDRYQSGSELAHALQNYKAAAPVSDPTVVLQQYPAIPGGTMVAPKTGLGTQPPAAPPTPRASTTTPMRTASAQPVPPAVASAAPLPTRVTSAGTSSPTPPPVPPSPPTGVGMVPPSAASPSPRPAAPPRPAPAPVHHKSHYGLWTTAVVLVLLLAALGGKYKAAQERLRADEQRLAQQQAQQAAAQAAAAQQATPATPPPSPPIAENPASAPSSGELVITSNPEGAKVQIDDRVESTWVTPFTAAHLKPGGHTIGFNKDGYSPATRTAEVAAGHKQTVSADLQPLQATLVVSSDPPGGHIFVDDADSGQVTPAQIDVSPGQHRVGVRKDGFKPAGTLADLGAGQSLNFSPKLQRKVFEAQGTPANAQNEGLRRYREALQAEGSGTVSIRSHPAGARILVNNRPTPAQTPAQFPMPPGSYRVTLVLEGYRPFVQNITVQKDQPFQIDADLQPR